MKFFKIFENSMTKETKSLSTGFNWFAFLLGIFYLAYKRLWKQAGILLAVCIVNGIFTTSLHGSAAQTWGNISCFIGIGIGIFLGRKANEWIADKMITDGWSYVKTVAGTNENAVNLGQYQDLPNSNNQQPAT